MNAVAQLVTVPRGEAYARLHEHSETARWGDAILLTRDRRTSFTYTSDDELAAAKAAVAAQHQTERDRVQQFASVLAPPGTDSAGEIMQGVMATGAYGVVRVWLGESNQASPFAAMWRQYRMPPVLPYGVNSRGDVTPLAADLEMRMERVSREEAKS